MSGTPAEPLRAFVEALVGAGVREAIVCPGSRSTPLALALRLQPAVRVLVHLDERAAGYFGLGLARAVRRPVVLLATSGTAAVNFGPAVVEARQGRVPLVVVSADRPPELRDRGANQTIDQIHLFGRQVKWFVELPVPEADPVAEAHLRWVAARAVATAAASPAGPVHVNWPFREPLVPVGRLAGEEAAGEAARRPTPVVEPHTRVVEGVALPDDASLRALADRLRGAERPLLVCGPMDRPGFATAIVELAAGLGAPVVADGLANLRTGGHRRDTIVAHADLVLRSAAARAALRPDLVLRFGATPTSKPVLTYLAETAAEQIVVDDGGWNEPTLLPGTIVHADPVALAERLAAGVGGGGGARVANSGWLDGWRALDRRAAAALAGAVAGLGEAFEGEVFVDLAERLPEGTIVYVGNSMPVRDLDAYLPLAGASLRWLGNRGASGIDGVVSSALGAAAGGDPVLAVVGDLSFLHDLNAIATAPVDGLRATIVVVDNDGGGIFSFLPQAMTERPEVGLPAHFEELFGTPHGVDVLAVARALGAETEELAPGRVGEAVGRAVAASLERPGIRVLRLRTDRTRNVELHRRIAEAVRLAVEEALAGAEASPRRVGAVVSAGSPAEQ
ncbi:MAG TPA: 2-succinyl-5-enolpyruvyl-6-hydroxy-3-cyclohexene-1-carboxylic-acid synthase [Candidatus Binatia bacterium]|nr:2-succinyl-5-enolpyruvyl-6-hydroxy-3-cyclohexene-1-carboxylic-acid synthase [Candidatus Binatia bacterium]